MKRKRIHGPALSILLAVVLVLALGVVGLRLWQHAAAVPEPDGPLRSAVQSLSPASSETESPDRQAPPAAEAPSAPDSSELPAAEPGASGPAAPDSTVPGAASPGAASPGVASPGAAAPQQGAPGEHPSSAMPPDDAVQTSAAPVSASPPEGAAAAETEPLPAVEAYLNRLGFTGDGQHPASKEVLYQLFIVNPDGVTGVVNTTVCGAASEEALSARPVCGFIYQENNMTQGGAEQFRSMIEGQQRCITGMQYLPLITCVDEEGGSVYRVRKLIPDFKKDAMFRYRDGGPEQAYDNARAVAGTLRGLGLNTDLAPVADVWSNPSNQVIGSRAYSDSFDEAAELVGAAVRGFHMDMDMDTEPEPKTERETGTETEPETEPETETGSAGAAPLPLRGVLCTLKHFPGHGDTRQDSHAGMATVTKSLEQVRAEEYLPFLAGIEAGADMVMVGHLTLTDPETLEAHPELRDVPATFSRTLIEGELRGRCGFQGVVITDSLSMGAVTKLCTPEEACVRALCAGCDILLGSWDQKTLDACVDYLWEQLRLSDGEADGVGAADVHLRWDRIEESLRRVAEMKLRRGLVPAA